MEESSQSQRFQTGTTAVEIAAQHFTTETSDNSLPAEPDELCPAAPKVQQFPLTQYQSELLDKLLCYVEDLQNSPRSYLPPLRGRKLSDLSAFIKDVNVVLLRTSVVSLTELSNLYYCAARVVIDECGVSAIGKGSAARQSMPPWEIRLRNKLQKLGKDLSWLCELNTGRLSQFKVLELNRKYNLCRCSVIELCEELRQNIKAIQHRLNRYIHKKTVRQQNSLFSSNQHRFYQQLNHQTTCTSPPPKKETLQFWSDLWSVPKNFNSNASWISSMAAPSNAMSFECVALDVFHHVLKKIPNWKSPGLDLIHGFWIKKFSSLHSYLFYYFNNLLSGAMELDPSLVLGRTVLIVKDPVKGNVPSNYRPITCLSIIWKFLTSIIRHLLYSHLCLNKLLPPQQKGATQSSKGTKDHLLVDKLIMHEAKQKKKNLHMAWIDLRKAYDSVPHDWILYCLNKFGVHLKIV